MTGETLTIAIGAVFPNAWNPNRQDAFIYEKEVESIRRFGFIDPVITRSRPKHPGEYEIIDGEHRWKGAADLGYREIPIYHLGEVPDPIAKQLTIVLNETRGQAQPDKLSDLLGDLLKTESVEDLLRVLPYTKHALDSIVGLKDFDWGTLGADAKEAKWVERTFRLPPDAAAVVDDAIGRVKTTNPSTPDWQALEFIAAEFLGG